MAVIQLNATTYGVVLPSGDMIEVGDIKSADFKPHAKLNRWGNECSMSIGLPTIEKVLPVVEGEKLKWKGKEIGDKIYRFLVSMKDGGLITFSILE